MKSKKRKQQLLRFVSFVPFLTEVKGASENKMEDKEAYQQLSEHIQSLAPNQLTAIVLNKLEGFSIEQVAQIMGLSYKAVESLLQRGKENLQKKLNPPRD